MQPAVHVLHGQEVEGYSLPCNNMRQLLKQTITRNSPSGNRIGDALQVLRSGDQGRATKDYGGTARVLLRSHEVDELVWTRPVSVNFLHGVKL